MGQPQIMGFTRIEKLGVEDGVEQWLATSNRGELRTDWILKEVDLTAGNEAGQVASDNLKAEYIRYQQLNGVAGVAICAALVSDGERLVLPIRQPRGQRLSELPDSCLDKSSALSALRTLISAIEQFELRDLGHAAPSADQIFLDDQGGVTFLASSNRYTPGVTASDALKLIWEKLSHSITSPAIVQRFAQLADTPNFAELRFLIAAEQSGKNAIAPMKTAVAEGELLLGRYRLEFQLEDRGGAETWKARHDAGKFPLVCTVVSRASERWLSAQHRLSLLIQNFHPGVERVFDIEHLPEEDIYVVSRAWVDAEPLETLTNESRVMSALITALEALAYLHGMGVLHLRICPETVLVQQDRAVLIALSALPQNELADTISGYVHDSVAEEGWSARADLWALIKTVLDTVGSFNEHADVEAYDRLSAFVNDPNTVILESDYVSAFGLKPKTQITALPSAFAKDWGISNGYMTFLTIDMLNDGQPRSRNQIVLNALRSRRIAGNRTNKSSMSATVSRLKSAGIAEDHGKKIRLTSEFLKDWTDKHGSDAGGHGPVS